jgi:ferredoxin-thioredoxin reductase catalytic subunit
MKHDSGMQQEDERLRWVCRANNDEAKARKAAYAKLYRARKKAAKVQQQQHTALVSDTLTHANTSIPSLYVSEIHNSITSAACTSNTAPAVEIKTAEMEHEPEISTAIGITSTNMTVTSNTVSVNNSITTNNVNMSTITMEDKSCEQRKRQAQKQKAYRECTKHDSGTQQEDERLLWFCRANNDKAKTRKAAYAKLYRARKKAAKVQQQQHTALVSDILTHANTSIPSLYVSEIHNTITNAACTSNTAPAVEIKTAEMELIICVTAN